MHSNRRTRFHGWSAHNRAHHIAVLTVTTFTSVAMAALVTPSAWAAAPGEAPQIQANVPITFSVTGDAPYGDDEIPEVQEVLDDHNLYSTAEFFVHVGDIFLGGTMCDEYRFEQMADLLSTLAVPAFIIPGDNETKDCVDPPTAWEHWTEHLLGIDQTFCNAPNVSRQSARPENFAFIQSNVLFVGIHLVGGSNPAALLQDDADWVGQQLSQNQSTVRAAVIFSQAGPGDADLFFDQFELDAQAFAKPILYVHGDGHEWDNDFPFSAQNVRRIQVERGNKPPVHVTVTTNPDTVNTFVFERDPWPSGTPVYNNAPCVNAGPDKAISIVQQVYLVGSATDDGVPTSPGTLTYTWSKASGPGSVSFTNPNQPVTFASFSVIGTYTLRLRASDGALASTDNVRVTVTDGPPINDPPTAGDDMYTVDMNDNLWVSAPGVLGNDSDPNGDNLTTVLTSNASNGSLSLNANGSFSYTPNTNWFGTDTFRYRADDGVFTSGQATVTIEVQPYILTFTSLEDAYVVSDEPAKNFGDSGSLRIDEDTDTYRSYVKFSVSGSGTTIQSAKLRLYATNGSDDGATLYRVSNNLPGTSTGWIEETLVWQNAMPLSGPPVGSLSGFNSDTWVEFDVSSVVVGDGIYSFGIRSNSDDAARFSSKEGDDAPELLLYTIPGGGNANALPVARNDNYTVAEDAVLSRTAPGVLSNDTDGNGDVLTVILQTSPTQGALSFQPDGSFTYTPNANYNGADSFTYVADDNRGGQDPATVNLTVTSVNDPPVGSPEGYTTDEDTPLSVAAPGVLANDSDLDGDPLTSIVVNAPALGSLSLATDGSFSYTPHPDANGSDAFTYRVRDGNGGTDDVVVTVDITAVEDAPIATDDAYTTLEDTPLVLATPGVLANDSDAENDAMSVSVGTPPLNGVLALNADGSFTYTPSAHFFGGDTFTYTVTDANGGSDVGSVSLDVTSVNDVPLGGDDSYATLEDTPLTVPSPGVLANDSDADGDPLTATLVSAPARGTLLLNVDGSFDYTPVADDNGILTFTYRVDDGLGGSDTRTVTLDITPVEDAPVAVDDAFGSSEDTPLVVAAPGVLANDSDAEGDPLTVAVATLPQNGTLVLAPDGSFSFTPSMNFNGVDAFTYTVTDTDGDSDVGSVSLSVDAVNDAPVGTDDSYATNEDVPLAVAAPGVLLNDSDVDADPLSVSLDVPPTSGTLVLNADGSFEYTPHADTHGADGFTYVVADGAGGTDTRSVSLSVAPINDPPVGADDAYAGIEDTPLVVPSPGVLGNDTDVDGEPLTVSLATPANQGTVVLDADGGFTYTPDPDANGADAFMYVVRDAAGASDTRSVALDVAAVNDAPVGSDDGYSTPEDTVLDVSAPGVLQNDSDVDGDPLSVRLGAAPTRGALVLNADGSFTYTPDANENGVDEFTYVVDDGAGGSDTRSVTINVGSVNDAPAGADDAYAVVEDTPLDVSAPGVLANDFDADGDPLSVTLETPPSFGSVALNPDGSFSYTPNTDAHGVDSFTYRVIDGGGASDVRTVMLTVAPVNDAPDGADDAYATSEDTPLAVTAPGVLGNDSDVDGDALSVTVETLPAHGSLTLNADGSFDYSPASDYNGADSFTYVVSDAAAATDSRTVTLTISSVNDVPAPATDGYATDEDNVLNMAAPGVLENDVDADGDILQASLLDAPTMGTVVVSSDGAFVYTPFADAYGSDAFTYTVDDGNGGTSVGAVTMQIVAVQDKPRPTTDAYTTSEDEALGVPAPGVLVNDVEVDGDALTASLVLAPAYGTLVLDPDGGFTYMPGKDFNGADAFTYAADDGNGGTENANVALTVDAVNDAPVSTDDAFVTDEDAPLAVTAPGVLSNDSDVDGDALTAVIETPPTHGALMLEADGSFVYTPSPDFNGGDAFTYRASDGNGGSTTGTVTLTVSPRNDAPSVSSETYSSDEDTTLEITAPGVLANDTDVDGDPLTVTLNGAPTHGTLELQPDGAFTYTPLPDFHGTDAFTYRVADGQGGSQIGSVALTVRAVNDAPVSAHDTFSTQEDVVLDVAAPALLANDTDVDGDALRAERVSGPASGTLVLASDGGFTYTPLPDFSGTDQFSYRVSDGTAFSSASTVTIDVAAVNDAPQAVADVYALDEDTVLSIEAPGVLANDSDVEGNLLGATLVRAPAFGTLTLNPDGSFTYTPQPNFSGPDDFEYAAHDGLGGSATQRVTLNVSAVNDAPVASADAYVIDEDTTLDVSAPGLVENDTDVEGDALVVSLVSPPAQGSLDLRADGGFTYVPAGEFSGADAFTYAIDDGNGGTHTGNVGITVTAINDAPVALDAAHATDEDVVLRVEAPGLLSGATDADGDALAASLDVPASSGSVVVEADGGFTYTPNADFNGNDSFRYRIDDGNGAHDTATITLSVRAVQDAPQAAEDAYATSEDTPLVVASPGVLANDVDVDGDVLSASVDSGPAHGTLELQPDGGFTYTPAANFFGPDGFTYTLTDAAGTTDGGVVTLTVTPLNDAPVVAAETFEVDEDVTLVVAAPGVLANDSDVDGDALTVSVDDVPERGTLNLNPDGSFEYVPEKDFNGQDAFGYAVDDGNGGVRTARATISVRATNDAPVATADVYGVDEDTTLQVAAPGVLDNDTDVDGDALTVSILAAPVNGRVTLAGDGSFVYTPGAHFHGSDSFTYTVQDPSGASATGSVTVDVRPVNDAPQAADDGFDATEDVVLSVNAPGLLANDSDVDADVLSAEVSSQPQNGTLVLQPDGAFVYTPARDFSGSDTFAYITRDGQGGQDTATVEIRVAAVNDPPATQDDAYSLLEDGALQIVSPGVLSNDSDVEGDALRAEVETAPDHGTLRMQADGGFTYVPHANTYGPDTFTYAALDVAGARTLGQVTLTVQPVNDVPVALADSFTARGDTRLVVAAPGLLDNDADVDGDSLSVELVEPPRYGQIRLLDEGAFEYTPQAGFTGSDAFSYRASDGVSVSAEVPVHLAVEGRGVTSHGGASGATEGGSSVSTGVVESASSPRLYLMSVSMRPYRRVQRIEGLQLEWQLVRSQCVSGDDAGVEVWAARGSGVASTVTAHFDAPVDRAVAHVAQFTGVDAADPIGTVIAANAVGVDGECTEVVRSDAYGFEIETLTEAGIVFAAVAMGDRDHTPEGGFVERMQQTRGSGLNAASLAVVDRAVGASSGNRLSGRFDGEAAWAVVTIEIRSQFVPDDRQRFTNGLEAWPNPFNAGLTLEFTLYRRTHVNLRVYDASGRIVRHLLNDVQPPGRITHRWDAKDDRGRTAGSGVYFVRMDLEGHMLARKVILLK